MLIIQFLLKHKWFIINSVISLILGFVCGQFLFPKKPIKTIEKQIIYQKVEQKESINQKKDIDKNIKVTITKPDGTKIERVDLSVIKTDTKKESETKTETKIETVKIVENYRPNYSIFFNYPIYSTQNSFPTSFDYQKMSIGGGYRIFGDFWVTSEFEYYSKTVKIGVRLDF